MSLPRPVVENRAYMVTRRCAQRRFYLRPCKEVDQAFLYCLAVAVKRYGVEVYWLSVLSNHYHLGIRDVHGNYPEFAQFFHSLVARCLNALLSRWENFWSAEQCGVLHLGDAESIIDKMIYWQGLKAEVCSDGQSNPRSQTKCHTEVVRARAQRCCAWIRIG